MSRIVLTGSAGFIGSHLVERFLSEGHEVVGVDTNRSGQRQNIDRLLGHPCFTFVEQDVSLGLEVAGEVDWVLHFASPQDHQPDPIESLMIGAQGTQHGLELARRKGARFLLASSSEVYGDPMVHPQPESYWGNVNPNGLRSCHAEAGRYAEALTMAYHRIHGLDSRIARIFNPYGPRMRPDDGVVSSFIHQALRGEALIVHGDGSQSRSFLYVSDLVEGIVRLMGVAWHSPVNLGNPAELTVLSFAKLIRGAINPALPIVHEPMRADDPRQRRPDIGLARSMLDWEPLVSFPQGLASTISYFQQDNDVSPILQPRPAPGFVGP